mgnify:CR=1 FL=1
MERKSKYIEIVEGDGSGINMSPVSNHIVSLEQKTKKGKKLIIPQEKKVKNKKDNNK